MAELLALAHSLAIMAPLSGVVIVIVKAFVKYQTIKLILRDAKPRQRPEILTAASRALDDRPRDGHRADDAHADAETTPVR